MLEGYIICTLVLIINTAVICYMMDKKFSFTREEDHRKFIDLMERINSLETDIEITNENVLKLSHNVVELE